MDINTWLNVFHDAWKRHDINQVMQLFSDDVEYWETPHMVLHGKEAVLREWQAILDQQNISVTWKIFNSSQDNYHSVVWHLDYTKNKNLHSSSGVYLIKLDAAGLCEYFYYVGKSKTNL